MARRPLITDTVNLVGFRRRLLAAIWDGIIIGFFTFVLATLIGIVGLVVQMFNSSEEIPMDRIIILTGLVFGIIYYVGFWSSSGQTFGKSMLGIRVVGKDGKKLNVGKAILRYIGYLISGIVLSLGFLWVLFDGKRQGWHDKIAGTYVVEADDEWPATGEAKLVVADPEQRKWTWIVLWFLLALVAPGALFGSLFILGPIVSRVLRGMFGGG